MFADTDLAKRLREHAKFMARGWGAAVEALGFGNDAFLDLGDAHATYAGEASPLTQAAGRFDRGKIEAIGRFYVGRATSWEAVLTPYDGPEAMVAVIQAGGHAEGWESTLYRTLDDLPAPFLPPGVTIELAQGAAVGAWRDVGCRGFFGDSPSPVMVRLSQIIDSTEGRRYLARVDGKPAAAAMLSLHEGTAFLGGMATLPEFRRRGLQGALLARRLRDAAQEADLAWIGATPGSGSQRNAERAGFRLAYSQISFRMPLSER